MGFVGDFVLGRDPRSTFILLMLNILIKKLDKLKINSD